MKANIKKFQFFEFKAGFNLSLLNMDPLLDLWQEAFRSSGNPIYAWTALHFSIRAKKPLRAWIVAYLAECTERMMSNEEASDLRKVLPEILGFPKRRPGPGKPLRDGSHPDKDRFTTKFMNYIMQGDDPKTARDNACNDMSRKFADKYDDKALVKILVDNLGLPKTPKNASQWKGIVQLYAVESIAQLTLWDASKTEEDRAEARAEADKIQDKILGR